jgi:hypothetical protein
MTPRLFCSSPLQSDPQCTCHWSTRHLSLIHKAPVIDPQGTWHSLSLIGLSRLWKTMLSRPARKMSAGVCKVCDEHNHVQTGWLMSGLASTGSMAHVCQAYFDLCFNSWIFTLQVMECGPAVRPAVTAPSSRTAQTCLRLPTLAMWVWSSVVHVLWFCHRLSCNHYQQKIPASDLHKAGPL